MNGASWSLIKGAASTAMVHPLSLSIHSRIPVQRGTAGTAVSINAQAVLSVEPFAEAEREGWTMMRRLLGNPPTYSRRRIRVQGRSRLAKAGLSFSIFS